MGIIYKFCTLSHRSITLNNFCYLRHVSIFFLLEKSGRHERVSPGKSAISKVQCVLPFQVRQFSKFCNKKRCVNFTHRFASVWSSVSPFQDRFVFFRNRSHCGLKWAGEGSGAEAPVLPSCATHPPLPVSGSVFGSCAATP